MRIKSTLLSCLLAASVAAPLASSQPGRIAFASNRDGDFDIYLVQADGTGLRALTRNDAEDRDPVWSPDGRQIAFVSRRDGNSEIYVVKADGSDERRLTSSAAVDSSPAWSPDGQRLAFVSDRVAGGADLYVLNVRSGSLTRVTDDAADDWQPSWSPDGRKILFLSGRQAVNSDGAGEMYLVDAAGGVATPVLTAARKVHAATWSPDGKRIAFFGTGNRRHEISVVNVDGSSELNFSAQAAAAGDSLPVWAPTGDHVGFLGDRDATGAVGVFVMNADGGAARRVSAPDQRVAGGFSWSPDGRQVVYSGFTQGRWALHVVDAQGTGRRQVTSTTGMDIGAAWAPR